MVKGLIGFILGAVVMLTASFMDLRRPQIQTEKPRFTCPIEMDIREVAGKIEEPVVKDMIKRSATCVRA